MKRDEPPIRLSFLYVVSVTKFRMSHIFIVNNHNSEVTWCRKYLESKIIVKMFKSDSHKHKKIIQKILMTDKYSIIKAVIHIYIISSFTLTHHFQSHQSQVLEHVQY